MAGAKASKAHVYYRQAVLLAGFVPLFVLTLSGVANFDDWRGVLFFLALIIAAECVYIPLPNCMLTVGFSIELPAFIMFGSVTAAWLSVLSYVVGNAVRRQRLHVILFNGAQYALSCLGGGLAYRLVGGTPRPDEAGRLVYSNALGVIAFIIAYFLINHLLVQALVLLRKTGTLRPRDLFAAMAEPMRWDLFTCPLTIPLGLMLAWLYSGRGALTAGLVIVPVLAVGYIFRLHFSLAHANRELTTLYEVAQKVSSVLDLEKLFDIVADAIRQVTAFDICALYLWDEMKQELSLGMIKHPTPGVFEGFSIKLGDGIIGAVARNRSAEVIDDASADPRFFTRSGDSYPPRSMMVVPLIVEDQLVGALSVGSLQAGIFTREHLRLLTILASQAAVAVENAILYRRTEQLAITDPMTSLYNYRYFYVRLGDELKRARVQDSSVSLVYIDLDNFKQYNDTFGHPTGDRILREFAAILRASVRDVDTPVRYAGDEFVILLANTDVDEARQVAERIRRSVESHMFLRDEAPGEIKLTISAGVAAYPRNAKTESELIYLADQAMYCGKRQGLNRVYAYGGEGEGGGAG